MNEAIRQWRDRQKEERRAKALFRHKQRMQRTVLFCVETLVTCGTGAILVWLIKWLIGG